jgi:imidazolonepropionase-like amidohydrolase
MNLVRAATQQTLLLGAASIVAIMPVAAQGPSDSTLVLALVGARLYRSPEAAPLDGGVILISRGLITAVGSRASVRIPPGASLVDCSGGFIVAGLWNSHVHFTEPHWAGADTLPAPVLTAQLERMLTRYGFVRVLDTGSLLQNTLALRHRIERG